MKQCIQIFCLFALTCMVACKSQAAPPKVWDAAAIDKAWTSGETLPPEVVKKYPLPSVKPKNDTGINVLVDLVHQCNFQMMWQFPGCLKSTGFRPCGSQAIVDSVLKKGGHSRARIIYQKGDREKGTLNVYPFAWVPNPEFNVIVTFQSSSRTPQQYLPQEIAAIEQFVAAGGGLVIIGSKSKTKADADGWSLNTLASKFGGKFTAKNGGGEYGRYAALELSPEWEPMAKGPNGTVRARRQMGKGRVVLLERASAVAWHGRKDSKTEIEKRRETLKEIITWAAAGKPPVNCEGRLPSPMSGGGGIYPEKEINQNGVVFYYAANQVKELVDGLLREVPIAAAKINRWLPSKPPREPMYLVLSSGGGGGWAINAYKPRENGLISTSLKGCISIFAHELAHTMSGPPNANNEVAGSAPHHDRGEAHAGFWQGKYTALYTKGAFRNYNKVLEREKQLGEKYDLAKSGEAKTKEQVAAERKKWKAKAFLWSKMGYVWNKMEDRYGTTWYPRWRWVQHTRWKDKPGHQLSWGELVEDMSIAAGEDLFPFFIKLGTTLKKKRLEKITFQGKTLHLKPAPIEPTPCGKLSFDPPGDFTKPIALK